jgi:hypothetical protein
MVQFVSSKLSHNTREDEVALPLLFLCGIVGTRMLTVEEPADRLPFVVSISRKY